MKHIVNILGLIIIGIVVTNPATAQDDSYNLCLHGCPEGSPETNKVIKRSIYTLSNNGTTKFADWVAYRVTVDTIGDVTRKRNFRRDRELSADETLETPDYKGASKAIGIDRGHQAPLASFSGTNDWGDTNILSNITPQKSDLNQGAWVKLETRVRLLGFYQYCLCDDGPSL